MSAYEQIDFLELVEARNEEIKKEGGFEVKPGYVVRDIEDAISGLGFEVGRIGTVLDEIDDYQLLGNFSTLYANNVMKFAELLLKKKVLAGDGMGQLEELLKPAIEAARERLSEGSQDESLEPDSQ